MLSKHDSRPEIIDVSLPLDAQLAVWPGDTAFDYELTWKKSAGATVNVGAVRLSTHCGTHIDAPFHFDEQGKRVDQLDLATFVGMAFVIHVPNRRNISRNDLSRDWQGATRLLLRTDAWDNPHVFPKEIPVIDPDVPDWLGSRGIVLLGLDLPSVDELDSQDLLNHHALCAKPGRHPGIAEFEGRRRGSLRPRGGPFETHWSRRGTRAGFPDAISEKKTLASKLPASAVF